ncbi:DUF3426 domain-containing protein [Stenotrophomonas sp. ISL-67]|uniref:DUF3426 domain-containing protein n=1 Tax=Stenotrophomonas sp. ISL-67 TaxID=2819171 RepID=UPI001BEA5C39|nr:DUF3426 domain-containing protein [Stenotrophomonas sp. ISL-67]MBT2767830.1 DUF3426 domain-containing protein [Stenotrophomonas sp. ISL-67]
MTEPTPPPRRPLATFLRASTEPTPEAVDAIASPPGADHNQDNPVAVEAEADISHAPDADEGDAAFKRLAEDTGAYVTATPAPSFMRAPEAAPPTPRWQWGLVAGLVVLLSLQIAVADRARLAADAGSRPWIAGLCGVLHCRLPAWQEPAAFSMISRDVRPVPGQPGALQVQASFRNDARWEQAWPSLRLSLSDPDGRVIGTRVFASRDYLDPTVDAASVLEPGQSAQIAFRVREPAASTVAFTFEFL